MNEVNPAQLSHYVAWGAFALAFVFGAVGNKTDFCTMGAVSDWVNMGDFNRMRMWLLAIAVAVIGANALQLAGLVNLSKSIYQTPTFTWLSYIVGGFLFGVGMTLGSGCGSKTLIRIGAGNLKSVIVFVFLGTQTYIIAGEVFPTKIRARGAGFAASFAKIGAVATAFLFPILLADIGKETLLIVLVGTSLIGALITYTFRIETAGRNLEEIDAFAQPAEGRPATATPQQALA